MLTHTDAYMLQYRAGYSMFCNKMTKTILNPHSWSSNYLQSYDSNYSNSRQGRHFINSSSSYSPLNNGISTEFFQYLNRLLSGEDDAYNSTDDEYQCMRAVKQLDRQAYYPYKEIMKKLVTIVSATEGCEILYNALIRRILLQETLLKIWAFKSCINVECIAAAILEQSSPVNNSYGSNNRDGASDQRELYADKASMLGNKESRSFITGIVWHQHRSIAKEMGVNTKEIQTIVHSLQQDWEHADASFKLTNQSEKGFRKVNKWLKYNCGLYRRPVSLTRSIIKQFCMQGITDIGFIILLCFICVTIVRAVPLIMELYTHNAFNFTRFTSRCIIAKHARGVFTDIKEYCVFITYTICIFALVVGVPSYLSQISNHFHSMSALNKFAREHLKETLWYLCELLSLITAWRSYKLIIRSSLYTALVPAACIGEAITFISTATQVLHRDDTIRSKFYQGLVLFYVLFIGIIVGTVHLRDVIESDSGLTVYSTALYTQFIIGICILSYMTISTMLVSFKAKYWTAAPTLTAANISSETISWSHLFAIAIPVCESIQLCAIILYFYWSNSNYNINLHNQTSETDHTLSITRVLMWNKGSVVYKNSMTVAVIAGLISTLLISIPLAVSASKTEKSLKKWNSIVDSPLYEFINMLLTRLFHIWIIASLFRPSGCAYSHDPIDGMYYLSTSDTVYCGGLDDQRVSYWSSLIALPLLCYMLITSTILHADSAEFNIENTQVEPGIGGSNNTLDMRANKTIISGGIKYAPMYAIVLKCYQYAVVFICFIGFNSQNTLIPLGILIAITLLIIGWCGYWLVFKKACTIVSIAPLRTCGVVTVLWTTAVCMVRNAHAYQDAQSNQISNETKFSLALHIGWLIIVVGGMLVILLCHVEIIVECYRMLMGLLGTVQA